MSSDRFMQIKADDYDRIFGKKGCGTCANKHVIKKREECLDYNVYYDCKYWERKDETKKIF